MNYIGAGVSAGASAVFVTAEANGGAGGAVGMTNSVGGSTANGALYLQQRAAAELGGDSAGGTAGIGGAATSNLTFDDTANANKSATLSFSTNYGQYPGESTAYGGNGGAATANANLTGVGTINAPATAQGETGALGGLGRCGDGQRNGRRASGDRQWLCVGRRRPQRRGRDAGDGQGRRRVGIVPGRRQQQLRRRWRAPGREGDRARRRRWTGGPVERRNGPRAEFAFAGRAGVHDRLSVARAIVGLPNASDVNPILAANSNLNATFGSANVEFGLGELGGLHDANGAGSETITSAIDLLIDPSKFTAKDLLLGLYGGTSVGGGFTSLTFDVDVGSTAGVINQTFTSVAAAQTYFTNHAIDLGTMGASVFDVHIALTETTPVANAGFDLAFLLGSANPYSGG